MAQYIPFHPFILAIAQELQRQANENLEMNPLDVLKSMMEARPTMDLHAAEVLATQINDLMGIANPPDDQLRLALMLFLPHRRGSLFTANQMLLRDALFYPEPPCRLMASHLAVNLDAKWGEVLKVIQNLPLPPLALLNSAGVPAEAHHSAAAGPMPTNIQQFLQP